MQKKEVVQKRLTHYWEFFGRYIWWIVFVAVFNGLQYLQSIREELPPNWQEFLKVVSIFPDWEPIVWLAIFFGIALLIILESAHQQITSEIYYSMGERLKRLNRIPETGDYAFPKAINREHRRDLRTLEKRLEIVEKILNKYAGLD
jgi:hypothetical protein